MANEMTVNRHVGNSALSNRRVDDRGPGSRRLGKTRAIALRSGAVPV